MTREEANELLSRLADAITLVMKETGVQVVEHNGGVTYVSGPLWLRPVPVTEAIGALLGHAVARRLIDTDKFGSGEARQGGAGPG